MWHASREDKVKDLSVAETNAYPGPFIHEVTSAIRTKRVQHGHHRRTLRYATIRANCKQLEVLRRNHFLRFRLRQSSS